MNLFNSRRAGFVLRNLRHRIERGICELINCQLFAPVIRNENRVRPNRAYNQHGKHSFTTARYDADSLAVVNPESHRSFRMNFDVWLWTLLDEKPDSSRLIAGEILVDNSPTRQYQREFFVRNFFWRRVFERVKFCFAVR